MLYFDIVSVIANPGVLGAGIDIAAAGSLIAGVTAIIALLLNHRTSRRTVDNTEEVSYVDNNLKTMQALLDWHKADNLALRAENVDLRQANEEHRMQILRLNSEMDEIRGELLSCRNSCQAMSQQLRELGDRQP